jgi:hypothetical protein
MHKCESQHAWTHEPRTSSLHVKQTLSLSLSLATLNSKHFMTMGLVVVVVVIALLQSIDHDLSASL